MEHHFATEQTPPRGDGKPVAAHGLRDLPGECDGIIFGPKTAVEHRVLLPGGCLSQALPRLTKAEPVSIDDAPRDVHFAMVAATGRRMAWGSTHGRFRTETPAPARPAACCGCAPKFAPRHR